MRLKEILENSKEKVAVCVYGRINPPTIGHEKLISEGQLLAERLGGDFYVFPTQSHTPNKKALENKNPLSFDRKLYYLKEFFPGVNFVSGQPTKTLFESLIWLLEKGYLDIHMVTGGDRAQTFKDIVSPYVPVLNPQVDPSKALDLNLFEVHNIGDRNSSNLGVQGASGTKARQYAYQGKLDQFMSIIPGNNAHVKMELYNELRNIFGV